MTPMNVKKLQKQLKEANHQLRRTKVMVEEKAERRRTWSG
jgi:hypothetical protein